MSAVVDDRTSGHGGATPHVWFEQPAPWLLIAQIDGDLDQATVPPLRAVIDSRVARSRPGRLVLDLSEVRLLSAAGVGLLVHLHRRALVQDFHLVLVGAAHRAVHLPLRLTGALALFDTRPGRPPAPDRAPLERAPFESTAQEDQHE